VLSTFFKYLFLLLSVASLATYVIVGNPGFLLTTAIFGFGAIYMSRQNGGGTKR